MGEGESDKCNYWCIWFYACARYLIGYDIIHYLIHFSAVIEERRAQQSKLAQASSSSSSSQPTVAKAPVRKVEEKVYKYLLW